MIDPHYSVTPERLADMRAELRKLEELDTSAMPCDVTMRIGERIGELRRALDAAEVFA